MQFVPSAPHRGGFLMVRVLFVCLGNICRSPMAEGLFRDLVEREGWAEHVLVDSAGTHGYHIGDPPDPRAQAALARRGIFIGDLKGRQVRAADLTDFDYVLAMDQDNLETLRRWPGADPDRVRLFLDFAPGADRPREVPDPYYGGDDDFEAVYALLLLGAQGLLSDISRRLPR